MKTSPTAGRSAGRARPHRPRRLLVIAMSAAVLAGVGAVTQVSYAGSRDMYNTYDALAIARKIPNDQAGDQACAGVRIDAANAEMRGTARHAGHNQQQSSGQQPGGQSGSQPGQQESQPPQVPARCHQDTGGPVRRLRRHPAGTPNVRKPDRSRGPRPARSASTAASTPRAGTTPTTSSSRPAWSTARTTCTTTSATTTTSGASTDESLAAGRDHLHQRRPVDVLLAGAAQRGTVGPDANADGGGKDGNVGQILTATSAEDHLPGQPARARSSPMPRFLRIITGDAKAFTNGPANANAKWSCTGFEDRVLADKYPLCPRGSQVLRISDFQSCWDGKNIDSENHRSHIVFQLPDNSGRCPKDTVAVPQLSITLAYDVPAGRSFAVDGFPEQLHKPDHRPQRLHQRHDRRLMAFATECINSGRRC